MENTNSQEYLSLIDIIKVLKKKIIFIIVFTIICTGIMVVKLKFLTIPIYQASTTTVIVKDDANTAKDNSTKDYTQDEISLYQKMVDTYVQIAQSNLVIDKTSRELKNYSTSELAQIVAAAPITGTSGETQIIKLTATSNNKEDVANIVNTYCKNFIKESTNILPVGKIRVLDSAETPNNAVSQNKIANIAAGFLFGLILSVGIVFFRYYLDCLKIRNEKQIVGLLKIPVLVIME